MKKTTPHSGWMEEVVFLSMKRAGEPLTRRQIIDATGVRKAHVRAVIDTLLANGRIRQVGKSAPLTFEVILSNSERKKARRKAARSQRASTPKSRGAAPSIEHIETHRKPVVSLTRLSRIIRKLLPMSVTWQSMQQGLKIEADAEYAIEKNRLILRTYGEKRFLCNASKVGPGYSDLKRHFSAPFPLQVNEAKKAKPKVANRPSRPSAPTKTRARSTQSVSSTAKPTQRGTSNRAAPKPPAERPRSAPELRIDPRGLHWRLPKNWTRVCESGKSKPILDLVPARLRRAYTK